MTSFTFGGVLDGMGVKLKQLLKRTLHSFGGVLDSMGVKPSVIKLKTPETFGGVLDSMGVKPATYSEPRQAPLRRRVRQHGCKTIAVSLSVLPLDKKDEDEPLVKAIIKNDAYRIGNI